MLLNTSSRKLHGKFCSPEIYRQEALSNFACSEDPEIAWRSTTKWVHSCRSSDRAVLFLCVSRSTDAGVSEQLHLYVHEAAALHLRTSYRVLACRTARPRYRYAPHVRCNWPTRFERIHARVHVELYHQYDRDRGTSLVCSALLLSVLCYATQKIQD